MANADPDIPAEAPPSYQQATGSSTASGAASSSTRPAAQSASSTLKVPGQDDEKNGIPMSARRSMEDEGRPLPKGWVRTFDPASKHQFFVDTTKDPPRSIWMHPYDDEEYLSTLSGEERERIEEDSMNRGRRDPPSKEDIIAAHSDAEDEEPTSATSTRPPNELPPRPDGKGKEKDTRGFGRKFKDKVTGTTHEEREAQRRKRAEEERRMYEFHMKIRQAMATAQRTGQPQFVGKETDGKEIWVEPPNYSNPAGYRGGYGYDPYRGGVYTTPNARYIRPPNPYARPYGGGYGGGYGLPLALGGGLLGGLLLGDALGGF